jgi:hypothetical protein
MDDQFTRFELDSLITHEGLSATEIRHLLDCDCECNCATCAKHAKMLRDDSLRRQKAYRKEAKPLTVYQLA